MNGKEFKDVILFMANRWDEDMAKTIFGDHMGQHFWDKWVGAYGEHGSPRYKGPDYATMTLFYEMSTNYLDTLVKYAVNYYKKNDSE